MTATSIQQTTLLEGLNEAAMIVAGGVIVLSNSAARGLLGDSIELTPIERVISHPAVLEALDRPNDDLSEVELTGLGNSRRHYLMRSARLADGAQLVRFVDRSEARAAEQMRVDFVANASHELRTPLSTLIGYTETLREHADQVDGATREQFLTVVHEEARRMQRIIEDLISLSRIEAEKFTTPTDAVHLPPLIDQAIDGAQRMAAKRASPLVRDVDPSLPRIVADRTEILQLLDNLIMNALRYGEPGTPVTISAWPDGHMVHIAVTDCGEGIAPEHVARVTERFYRVDTSRSRSIGGTGLGLSIVKHIVERHRGRLKIDSELGKGTAVRVWLPIAALMS